jgi:hypothetical protein
MLFICISSLSARPLQIGFCWKCRVLEIDLARFLLASLAASAKILEVNYARSFYPGFLDEIVFCPVEALEIDTLRLPVSPNVAPTLSRSSSPLLPLLASAVSSIPVNLCMFSFVNASETIWSPSK